MMMQANQRPQQQHTLRKFPQRSQSLRVKSNVIPHRTGGGISGGGGGQSLATSRTSMKLVITNKDLIVQDDSPCGGTLSRQSSLFRNMSRQSVDSNSSTTKPITFFINCSSLPDLNLGQHYLKRTIATNNGELGADKKADHHSPSADMGDKMFEDVNGDDEGVITTEENLEESEDEYFDDYLEEDSEDSYQSSRIIYLLRHPQLGLGLSIAGGSDFSMPVIVMGLKPDSPAEVSQSIYIGDQIVAVNEVPINETTSHQDALRLLSECGDQVCLNLRHYKAPGSNRKRWKRDNFVGELSNELKASPLSTLDGNSSSKSADYERKKFEKQTPAATRSSANGIGCGNLFNRSNSMNNLNHLQRIDLFMAGISQYVSYSDKLRDLSLEVRSADGNLLVIQCSKEEICLQWRKAIKLTIDNLANTFMRNFNKHYLQREHFYYMGWVSECLSTESEYFLSNGSLGKHLPEFRWLPRYIIIKGGNIYLFKSPPTMILRNYMQKISNAFSRNHSGSSGSSLGSVGSSASDASNSSNSAHFTSTSFSRANSSDSNVILSKLRKAKPYRMVKLNKDLENELLANSIAHYTCYQTNFSCIKLSQIRKDYCFTLNSGTSSRKCYSTENREDLEMLERVWMQANYHSINRLKNKTFMVRLEEENIFGSFTLDWRFGFSFYDPKSKHHLWSYKFHQFKQSYDDGKSRLFITFCTEHEDVTHILSSSCLQTLIYCMQAFLSAKVFSIDLLNL